MERTTIIKEINESYKRIHEAISNAKYSSATKVINKLYHQSVEIGYGKGIEQYYENLAVILYYTHKNYLTLNSLKYLIKSYKKAKNKHKLAHAYRMLGVVLSRLGDFSSSYYYLNQALIINKKFKKPHCSDIVNIYSSLAFNTINLGDTSKALNYINAGLDNLNTPEAITKHRNAFIKGNIIKARILIKLEKISEAKDLYDHLINANYNLGKNEMIYMNELNVQILLRESNPNYTIVNNLLQTLLKNAIDIQDIELRTRTLKALKTIHSNSKNYELAYKYSNQLLKIQNYHKENQIDLLNTLSLSIPLEKEGNEFEIYLKKDLNVAAKYQSNFFKDKIKSEHFDLDILFSPAKSLSGDYLGTFDLSNQDNYYLFVLADVVGKGITASYISFMLDGIIKSIIYNTDSFNLKKLITNINTILADALNGQGFVSLWAGLYDARNNKLESINAGHLPTILIKQNKEIIELNQGSTILGMFSTLPSFESEIINFEKGDSLIAYSDGITEAMNNKGDLFENKFNDLVQKYATERDFNFIKKLESSVKKFQDDKSMQDDISCLIVKVKS